MKTKISVIGVLTILGILFLMQISTVYAAKPTAISFSATIVDYTSTTDPVEKNPRITVYTTYREGWIWGDFASARFVWVETTENHLTPDGYFLKHEATILIRQTDSANQYTGDDVTIEFKYTQDYRPGAEQRSGHWRIVSGAGAFATAKGNGEYTWVTRTFDGRIH